MQHLPTIGTSLARLPVHEDAEVGPFVVQKADLPACASDPAYGHGWSAALCPACLCARDCAALPPHDNQSALPLPPPPPAS